MKFRLFRVPVLLILLLGLSLVSCQTEEPAPSAPIPPQPTSVNSPVTIEEINDPPEVVPEEQPSEEGEPAESPVEEVAEDVTSVVEPVQETAVPAVGSTVQHQVQVGDWLMQIARCYGADYAAVRKANPQLANPNFIMPGMMVTVPNVGSESEIQGTPCVAMYTVALGDTWSGLAIQFGTTAVILQRVNPGPLLAGDQIIVPVNTVATNP